MNKKIRGTAFVLATLACSGVIYAASTVPYEDVKTAIGSTSTVKSNELESINEMANSFCVETVALSPQERATVKWNDTTVPYNTRMKFTRSNGDPFIVRKGVEATFSFNLTEPSNIEFGFMDDNGDVLEVIYDDELKVGLSLSYTPRKDVSGYFYVWNKSADDIYLEDISMQY